MAEFLKQGKVIILGNFPAYTGINEIEETYKAAKENPGGIETSNGKGNGKTVLWNYVILNFAWNSGKVPRTTVDNMRLNVDCGN